jgi:L-alanine-DL-glutamate epimerase-like enolase superfamily enzyme
MKITKMEARRYSLPLDPPFAASWDPVPRRRFEETILIVSTDEGLVGYAGGAPVPDLALLEHLLAGADPTDTERIFGVIETVDFHAGRNWTVEVAMWDLIGRLRGIPLWQALGGTRSSFPAYASCGERIPPQERAERLAAWRELGIRAAKIRFHDPDWRKDLKVVEAARAAVGADMELMVDANQGWRMPGDISPRWDVSTAVDCASALSDLGVYWLEEPLDTQDIDGYAELAGRSKVRIAAGEMVRHLADAYRLIDSGGVDFIQNDVVLAGGITGCRHVADRAAATGVTWSPHTWSTGFGLVANLHAALAFSSAEFIEVPFDPPAWTSERRDFMLPDPLEITTDGSIAPPDGPGLGVEPDLEYLERWRVG